MAVRGQVSEGVVGVWTGSKDAAWAMKEEGMWFHRHLFVAGP